MNSLIYSTVMAKDNYLMEHLQGPLLPLKDLAYPFRSLKGMAELVVTQRKNEYLRDDEDEIRENSIGSRGVLFQLSNSSPY